METASQAGLTLLEINGLINGYDRLRDAQAAQGQANQAIEAEAAAANKTRADFAGIAALGTIPEGRLDSIAGLRPGAQLQAMADEVHSFEMFVTGGRGYGRASGGPMRAGSLYEVGEGNVAEMFVSGGRQFMVPGNDGNMIGGAQLKAAQYQPPAVGSGGSSQMDPHKWGALAADSMSRRMQQNARAA